MTGLLVVSGDTVRTAELVAALSGRFSVGVVEAVEDEEPVSRLVVWLSPQPRRGRAEFGPRRSAALLQAVADHRPRAVLFVGSHLAAAAPAMKVPVFVDFPSLAVRGTGLEALKARWWEPVEARRAVVASTPSTEDAALLTSWGARAVVVADGSSAAPLLDAVETVA